MKAVSAKVALILILIALFSAILGGCFPGGSYTKTRFLMDTKVDLVLYGLPARQAESVAEEIFAEMDRLENILSRYVSASDVNRINAAAGRVPVEVQPETIEVVQKALEIAELSGGAFDPTVGSLLELWGWGVGDPVVPPPEDIKNVLSLVDYQLIEIDVHRSTVFLPLPAMKMDLGGIAKGYIADRGQALAKELSCSASYINAGGDINIEGQKPDGKDWRIAIQDPRDPQKWAAVVPLQGGSIVAQDALLADALATAVFVLGREEGLRLLESLDGIEGVVIDPEGRIYASSGLVSKIEISSSQENDECRK